MNQPIQPSSDPAGPYATLNPYGGGPQPPPPPPPPSSARRRRGRALLAAAAALLVLGGAGAWYATSGDARDDKRPTAAGSGPSPAAAPSGSASASATPSGLDAAAAGRVNAARKADEAKLLYLRRNAVDVPNMGADNLGPWQVGDTVVTAMYRTVTAYSAADGREKWSLPLRADLCTATPHMTADNRIVVVTKEGPGRKGECRRLQVVDLKTGRAGWERIVAQEHRSDSLMDFSLAFVGDTLAVGRPGAFSTYRMSDGERLYGSPAGSCTPSTFAGGPKLIAAVSCLVGGADKEVQELDPATGKARWSYRLPPGSRVEGVLSVKPLVVVFADNETGENRRAVALTEDGALRSTLADAAEFQPYCAEDMLDDCRAVVDSGTLYVATDGAPDGSKGDEILAVDLATGKTARRISLPVEAISSPIGMSGRDLLINVSPLDGGWEGVASVAPGATEPRVLMRAPVERVRKDWRLSGSTPLYADGRYILVAERVSGFTDAEERDVVLMTAFGT
ncbi:outer membrane protein assembly factor BamB family protein [Streptomyces sp. NPDC000229]|uniref:outer membrane protein assembly factor BamB family protein n=1 Tax=Streptomyces sp. NPDC000229 TaxID=3154247 RepID=UPI003326AF6C